jgi:Zn-finger protein
MAQQFNQSYDPPERRVPWTSPAKRGSVNGPKNVQRAKSAGSTAASSSEEPPLFDLKCRVQYASPMAPEPAEGFSAAVAATPVPLVTAGFSQIDPTSLRRRLRLCAVVTDIEGNPIQNSNTEQKQKQTKTGNVDMAVPKAAAALRIYALSSTCGTYRLTFAFALSDKVKKEGKKIAADTPVIKQNECVLCVAPNYYCLGPPTDGYDSVPEAIENGSDHHTAHDEDAVNEDVSEEAQLKRDEEFRALLEILNESEVHKVSRRYVSLSTITKVMARHFYSHFLV